MYINFSDAAKYADVARNLVNGLGFGNSFTFWSPNIFDLIKTDIFSSLWTPPVMPYSIAAFFKIFGVGDFAVIATSFFYFILTLIFVYLLGKNVFDSKLVGALSALAVGFNYDLIHYATSGASESPFVFEIVAASYLASIKRKWATALSFLFLIFMYFTRSQSFVYIVGVIFYWLLVNFKLKKALVYLVGLVAIGLLVDYFVLMPLSGKYFLYSVVGRGLYSSFGQTSAVSDTLRGTTGSVGEIISNSLRNNSVVIVALFPIVKKVFYNLYNFYKLLPQIMSPYLFALFVIGLFSGIKNKTEFSFKIASALMIMITFLVTAASIPFFRYLHPVIPLVYILATGTLVEIISKFEILSWKQIPNSKSQIRNKRFTNIVSTFLVLIFGVGQTVGVLLLDSRFERNTHNVDKPPVYVELSRILKENTIPEQVVVTNLDTWGSWYGERKTIWFPLEPKQIIDPATGKIPFDAIYLTSYLIDDPNYYMGGSWRMVFENPTEPKKWICEGCSEIADEFTLKGIYEISADSNYEKQKANAVLLIKK